MPNHIHLIWHIQPGHKRENVQRDFLKYTAHKIKFDLLENDKEWLQQFKVDAKDRRYPRLTERAGDLGKKSLSTGLYNHKAFLQKVEYIPARPRPNGSSGRAVRRASQSCAGQMEFSWHSGV
jgi:REP element-mobilizing transposase RayT